MQIDTGTTLSALCALVSSGIAIGVVKQTVNKLEMESSKNEDKFVSSQVFNATLEPIKIDLKEIKTDLKELLKHQKRGI